MPAPPAVLSIAGSDPSGGAGIQADLKTFHAFGVYGMAVLTSLTAQNTRGVFAIHDVPAEFVGAQLRAVFDDVDVRAVKTGMLKTPPVIEQVADSLAVSGIECVVVDPVMVATSGDRLIDEDAVEAMRRRLFPLAAVVTPNRAEAAVLAGRDVSSIEDATRAAEAILDSGAGAVLVKGLPRGTEMVDLLQSPTGPMEFRRPALDTGATHGTGCTLSSAMAACLSLGDPLETAIRRAKDFVWRAMEAASPIGGGSLPLNHLVPARELRS